MTVAAHSAPAGSVPAPWPKGHRKTDLKGQMGQNGAKWHRNLNLRHIEGIPATNEGKNGKPWEEFSANSPILS